MEQSQYEDLVAAYRTLAEHGVIDAYGHVSMRSPSNPKRYFIARSLAPEHVQVEDIMEYDLDSVPLDAKGRDSVSERFIHGEIYKARPEVMSVVHNHSPSVIPFSVTGVPMKALWHMASFIGDGLPNFEIRDVRKGSDLLVRDPELGAALARTLGGSAATLMRGHGSVTVGENIARSVGRSIYLELSARMQMQAMMLGRDITWMDAAEVKANLPVQDYKRAWPLWREKALAKAKADRGRSPN
jgi:ribulose-5-phosphate 4-epimerase/fuculose-1-phosphate aldolase